MSLALPVLWPRLSEVQAVTLIATALVLLFIGGYLAYRIRRHNTHYIGRGGAGGNAASIGDDNDAEGGRGGMANRGVGGRGGSATVRGNRSRVRGGDGGNSTY